MPRRPDQEQATPAPIGPYVFIDYTDPADAFRPYDRRSPIVATLIAELIRERAPEATVEHVGSTAVPGCDGKGVIDLMVVYEPGRLDMAKSAVDALGFQPYSSRNPFPDDRPVRIGSFDFDGTTFRVHAHLIAADTPEVAEQLAFRDRLRADPALVAEYVASKRAVLAAGIRDSTDYNAGKDPFIRRVLAG